MTIRELYDQHRYTNPSILDLPIYIESGYDALSITQATEAEISKDRIILTGEE